MQLERPCIHPRRRQLLEDARPRLPVSIPLVYRLSRQRIVGGVVNIEVVYPGRRLCKELSGAMAKEFVDGCVDEADDVVAVLVFVHFGWVNVVARTTWIVVRAQAVGIDYVLEAESLSNVVILWA